MDDWKDPFDFRTKWSPKYQVYCEKHGLFDVFQELLKEIVLWRPHDPLTYISKELPRIAKHVRGPKVFVVGESPIAEEIAYKLSASTASKLLSLKEIIETSPQEVKQYIQLFNQQNSDLSNVSENLTRLLVATINRRIALKDCCEGGYVIVGFPQTKAQAIAAQKCGLLPHQVFIFLPDSELAGSSSKSNKTENDIGTVKSTVSVVASASTSALNANKSEGKVNYEILKEIASAYTNDIGRTIEFDRWSSCRRVDLEADLLGRMIRRKPRGAPWIPKVILIGPPGSGKANVADKLAEKFGIVSFKWTNMIRAAVAYDDENSVQAQEYLNNLSPLSEDAIKTILKRNLFREDSQSQGWVLHGFPETVDQAKILTDLCLDANRVFFLSCSPDISQKRTALLRKSIMKRSLPGLTDDIDVKAYLSQSMKSTVGTNPYTEEAVTKRRALFDNNIQTLSEHFGNSMTFVDATEKLKNVIDFVIGAILRPPVYRF